MLAASIALRLRVARAALTRPLLRLKWYHHAQHSDYVMGLSVSPGISETTDRRRFDFSCFFRSGFGYRTRQEPAVQLRRRTLDATRRLVSIRGVPLPDKRASLTATFA